MQPHSLIPQDSFVAQVRLDLEGPGLSSISDFQFHTGLLWHKGCLHIPEGDRQIEAI